MTWRQFVKGKKERHQLGNTVEGTSLSHRFEPQSCSALCAKHLSAENRFSINHSLSLPSEEAHEQLIASIKPNNYVTCQYGDDWWLALVMDVIQMRRTSLVS